jgi:hypothetical protein
LTVSALLTGAVGTKIPTTNVPATEILATEATEVPATKAPATEVLNTKIPAADDTEVLATKIPATEVPATVVVATFSGEMLFPSAVPAAEAAVAPAANDTTETNNTAANEGLPDIKAVVKSILDLSYFLGGCLESNLPEVEGAFHELQRVANRKEATS